MHTVRSLTPPGSVSNSQVAREFTGVVADLVSRGLKSIIEWLDGRAKTPWLWRLPLLFLAGPLVTLVHLTKRRRMAFEDGHSFRREHPIPDLVYIRCLSCTIAGLSTVLTSYLFLTGGSENPFFRIAPVVIFYFVIVAWVIRLDREVWHCLHDSGWKS